MINRPLPQAVLTSLFRRGLCPCLITAAAAPDSIKRSVGLDLIDNESTARAADAHRDVVAALDAHAVGVVAPNKVKEIAGGLNGEMRLVLFAVWVLSRCIVFAADSFEACASR